MASTIPQKALVLGTRYTPPLNAAGARQDWVSGRILNPPGTLRDAKTQVSAGGGIRTPETLAGLAVFKAVHAESRHLGKDV